MFPRTRAKPTWTPPAEFESLLAYYRARDRDAPRWQAVRELLRQPRWQAHWASLQHLESQRASAVQDGQELREFTAATAFCHVVARESERVFSELAQDHSPGVGTLEEWRQHANECLFCRRMWQRWNSGRTRAENGLPREEPLLSDWLLARHYAEALDARAAELSAMPDENLTALPQANLPLFLKKMRFVAPLLLERVLLDHARLAELTDGLLLYLERPDVLAQIRRAVHVRDELGQVLGRFLRERQVSDEATVQAAVTRGVMDNILWQLAARECQERARPGPEQAGLQAAREALRQRLGQVDLEASERVAAEALGPFLADAPELLSVLTKEVERLVR